MKIIHKMSMTVSDKEVLAAFKASGINGKDINGFWVFEIAETDPHWNHIRNLIELFDVNDSCYTRYSALDLESSEYLCMSPSWHHGYPQPEEDFGYLKVTYDLTDYCKKCDVGKKQVAPFRMKRDPVWGSRSILQLNWEFGEFFVKPQVWEEVFKPLGIQSYPVLHHRSGKVLETVVQLKVVEPIDLILGETPFTLCQDCGRKKYQPITRGWFPPPMQSPSSLASRSTQFFGSGQSAYNSILVSNSLFRAMTKANLKGVEFAACRQI